MYTNKNLTVMFTDICGFTQQTSTTSRSELMARLEIHNGLLSPVIHRWGGNIVKSIGDAYLLTFESPTDALHCAICLQHTLRVYNRDAQKSRQIQIKISVNCGEVTVTNTDVFGDSVNVAAKIEKATPANEIYFTEAVFLSMNQSEVPCEFVRTFAAKGDTVREIELYRILMDETAQRYQAILSLNAEKLSAETLLANRPPAARRILTGFARYWKRAGLGAAVFIAMVGVILWLKMHSTVLPTPGQPSQPSQLGEPRDGEQTETLPTQQPENFRFKAKSSQAASLAWAESIVKSPAQLKENSNSVIEKLAADFGAQAANNQAVQSLLVAALMSRIYWEARTFSFEKAGELLTAYRSRFYWITDWKNLEREQALGGFHNYASDQKLRRNWRNKWDEKWNDHFIFLKTFADTDPDFGFRLAVEFSEINRRNNSIAAPHEQELVSHAIQLKPALLQTERADLLRLVQWWLQFEQENSSLARNLVRLHFYEELRPWLVSNLMVKTRRLGQAEADFPWRQNCIALLADKNNLAAIDNPWTYIQNNAEVFMRASETVTWGDGTQRTFVFLHPEQMRKVMQRPMSESDKAALIQWLDQTVLEITSGNGPWANNEDSRLMAVAMQAVLLSR